MKFERFIDKNQFEEYLKIAAITAKENEDADFQDIVVPDWARDAITEAFEYTVRLADDYRLVPKHFVLYGLWNDAGILVGVISFSIDRHIPGSVHVDYVAIRKDERGKGYGAVLMNNAVEVARKHSDARQLLLSTVLAKNFYERVGMEVIGTIESEDAGLLSTKYFLRKKI